MFDHSKECIAPLAEPRSSRAALAIGSSWSLLQIIDKIFCSMPVSSTPSRVRTVRDSVRGLP